MVELPEMTTLGYIRSAIRGGTVEATEEARALIEAGSLARRGPERGTVDFIVSDLDGAELGRLVVTEQGEGNPKLLEVYPG